MEDRSSSKRGPRPKNSTDNYYEDHDIHIGTLEVLKCVLNETCKFFPEISPYVFGTFVYPVCEFIFCRIPMATRDEIFKNNYPLIESTIWGRKNM